MTKLKILFRCEAAGRENNEDNGKILQLGKKGGVLLVVCDGMGGMQAGEVASTLAVATIEEWFAPQCLTTEVLADPLDYLKKAIVGADTNIKQYTKKHPETDGMGTTVVLAWVIEKKVYVAWCGDSRAYRYNPQLGLERLSHDHSLVQSWVDAGQITEDQAFDHPQSNVVTRSLGDPNGVAMPEAAEYTLYNNDVLLLCSDGLCGTLRDREIENILSSNKDLQQCCEQLWMADEAAGWHDNVTTAMAQVMSGGAVLSTLRSERLDTPKTEILETSHSRVKRSKDVASFIKYACIVALLLCAAIFAYFYFFQQPQLKPNLDAVEPPILTEFPNAFHADSIEQASIDHSSLESQSLQDYKNDVSKGFEASKPSNQRGAADSIGLKTKEKQKDKGIGHKDHKEKE